MEHSKRTVRRLTAAAACTIGLASAALVGDTAAALADEVGGLPAARGPLASRQFSGYLDNGLGGRLHYWLVESESNPRADPVALWLNGGPGASSLMGYLTEFGPYVIAADGSIHYNPYNWAKRANVVFLESPAGVGFSYCDGNISATCSADDDTTAAGNLHALREFFERFPKFHSRQFMIWGESYAGVYVPTLSAKVAYAEPPLPVDFLGFSVGNPCTADRFQLHSSRGDFLNFSPDYALSVGLIDDRLYASLTGAACAEQSSDSPGSCRVARRTFDLLVSGLSGPPTKMPGLGHDAGFLDNYDTGAYIGSMQPYWDATAAYLNRADVRAALHMEKSPRWGLFATRLNYQKQYLACRDDADDLAQVGSALQHRASMLPIYANLTRSGHSVLLYSGDSDPSVQWRGSELAMRGVGIPEGAGRGWRPWFYVEEPTPLELLAVKAPEWGPSLSASPRRGDAAVLGGYVEEFVAAGTLTFATVRGVGHMVPQFRPQASLHLFDRTMQAAIAKKGSPPALSPPLQPDLFASASDLEFYGEGAEPGILGEWLLLAQADAAGWPFGAAGSAFAARPPAAMPGAVTAVVASAVIALFVFIVSGMQPLRRDGARRFKMHLLERHGA
mmetsp:Transcript_46064/g.128015  ORF Transcript_46064/g.128015 Transcript_46064/m.128015 type:complete len:617 (-) Transcript_46064:78-1928(-)